MGSKVALVNWWSTSARLQVGTPRLPLGLSINQSLQSVVQVLNPRIYGF